MAKHLNASEQLTLIAEYTAGATMRKLASKYERTPAAVCKLLKRHGVPARDKSTCQKPELAALRLPFPADTPEPLGPEYPPLIGQVGHLSIAVADPRLWNIHAVMARLDLEHRYATKHMLGLKAAVEARGHQLLLLWQDEVHSPGLRLLASHKAGNNPRLCSARQCQIVPVGIQAARAFYDAHHLQGRINAGTTYGLEYQGQLVACMSFAHGATCRGDAAAHLLSRFAAAGSVPGAASRLLRHYQRQSPGVDILSYSDERYAPTGGLYRTLGFEQVFRHKPDYRYWREQRWFAKSSRQKKHLRREYAEAGREAPVDREFVMAEDLGYLRCYDCGKLTWRLTS